MRLPRLIEMAHDVSLAAWLGGSAMGAISLNGATLEVEDPSQRIRVAVAGWFRWAPAAGLAALTRVLSASTLGRVAPVLGGAPARPLRGTRTAVTVLALLATAATGLSGQRVARAGDVPVADAVTPISRTPPEVARAQRQLRITQWAVPLATTVLCVLNVLQRRDPDV